MYIRTKRIANSSRYRVQLCACHRIGDKVKQKVIKHVGISENDSHLLELKKLAQALKNQILDEQRGPLLFPLDEEFEPDPVDAPEPSLKKTEPILTDISAISEQERVVDGFSDIFGTLFHQLKFDSILGRKHSEVLREVILARIATPASKRSTQHILAADFGKDISLDRIYRMMDALVLEKDAVQKAVFQATERFCFGKVDLLLFDVTTLFFESVDTDELRSFGYSKDQKFQSVQVVFALATTSEGLPIGYHLFPGNTAEVSTLLTAVEYWKQTLPIGKVRFVADRGLMSEENLAFLEKSGVEYVVAAKLKRQKQALKSEILEASRDKEGVIFDKRLDQRRLIVSFCRKREEKDIKARESILEVIDKRIGSGKSAKKLISNRGYQRYIRCSGQAQLVRDDEKIAQDAAWDGLHGVITNCFEESADSLLKEYKRLWVIEESFRLHKHNLQLRPIYHFKPERIEAHFLICYLAFALIRHLEMRVKIQKEKLSIEEMRTALWRVQSSYLKDRDTQQRYRLPSSMSVNAKKLYQVMGIKRGHSIQRM